MAPGLNHSIAAHLILVSDYISLNLSFPICNGRRQEWALVAQVGKHQTWS